MVTDLLSYWGTDKLRRYSHASTEGLLIPKSSRNFLEKVGLPVIDDPRFGFRPEASTFVRPDGADSYRRIGFYDSSPICVKDGEGGVYFYDCDNHHALFMNSSLEAFAILLTLYQQMLVKARSDTQTQERKALVSTVKHQMQSIDPQAFRNKEFYWPVIFEEIGYELD